MAAKFAAYKVNKRPKDDISGDETENEDNSSPIIIDNGSEMIRAGFSGDDAPRAVFPTRVKTHDHIQFTSQYFSANCNIHSKI